MKKLLNSLLNVATIIALLVTILGSIFLTLEPEVQAKIPLELREIIVLVVSNGAFGITGVATKALVARARTDSDKKIATLTNMVLDLTDVIEKIKNDLDIRDSKLYSVIEHNNDLKELELKIKATNPMIKEKHKKEIIEKVGE